MVDILFGLILSLLAGLSTGIGALIAYFIKQPKLVYLSFGLGLSAGVMIYVSFVELLPQGFKTIGEFWTVVIFFLGMLMVWLMEKYIPENPMNEDDIAKMACETTPELAEKKSEKPKDPRLMKTGLLIAVVITIHNFPEGMASFATALHAPNLAILIAIAIAIHNIPEGIAVSIPICYATNDKKKAVKWSFLSGLTEPIGAVITALFLLPILSDAALSNAIINGLLAWIAGIMAFISLDQILPTATKYQSGHAAIGGVVAGMIIMALSLVLLHSA
nr:zinc transporter ZupT [Candidatus Sigynarchaeota archaeon]